MDRRLKRRIAGYLARRSRRDAEAIRALDREEWFDLWHRHPDLKRRAGRAPDLVHLATLSLLRVAVERFAQRSSPLQIFATFCSSTGDNAVYLHSPNPNGSGFPHVFPGVVWSRELSSTLALPALGDDLEVARVEYDDEPRWIVRPRADNASEISDGR